MGFVYFGIGAVLMFGIAATFSVYGLGHFERAWGRVGSLQALWWASFFCGLLASVVFALGATVARNFPTKGRCAMLGIVVAFAFSTTILVAWSIKPSLVNIYGALLLLLVLSFVTPLIRRQAL